MLRMFLRASVSRTSRTRGQMALRSAHCYIPTSRTVLILMPSRKSPRYRMSIETEGHELCLAFPVETTLRNSIQCRQQSGYCLDTGNERVEEKSIVRSAISFVSGCRRNVLIGVARLGTCDVLRCIDISPFRRIIIESTDVAHYATTSGHILASVIVELVADIL